MKRWPWLARQGASLHSRPLPDQVLRGRSERGLPCRTLPRLMPAAGLSRYRLEAGRGPDGQTAGIRHAASVAMHVVGDCGGRWVDPTPPRLGELLPGSIGLAKYAQRMERKKPHPDGYLRTPADCALALGDCPCFRPFPVVPPSMLAPRPPPRHRLRDGSEKQAQHGVRPAVRTPSIRAHTSDVPPRPLSSVLGRVREFLLSDRR